MGDKNSRVGTEKSGRFGGARSGARKKTKEEGEGLTGGA